MFQKYKCGLLYRPTTLAILLPCARVAFLCTVGFAFNKTRERLKLPTQMNARAAGESAHHGNVKGKREQRSFHAHGDVSRIKTAATSRHL